MGLQEEYVEKMKAQVAELTAKIDLWKAKADKAEASAKIEFHQQLDALRHKRDAIQAKVTDLQTAGEGAWESLKSGVEQSWNDLKRAADDAAAKFR